MKDIFSTFIKKQKELFGRFADIFAQREKSLLQQERDYLRYGLTSPHVRKIEQAERTRIQWQQAFREKLHRLFLNLKKIADLQGEFDFQKQLIRKKEEEEYYWVYLAHPKKRIKTDLLSAQALKEHIQQFITMLTQRIKQIDDLIFKINRFKAQAERTKRRIIKKRTAPLLKTIKEKVKSKKLTYQSQETPGSPSISLDGATDLFLENFEEGLHSGKITPDNFKEHLWDTTNESGHSKQGILSKAVETSPSTSSLSKKEQGIVCEKIAEVFEKISEFVKLPEIMQAVTQEIDDISHMLTQLSTTLIENKNHLFQTIQKISADKDQGEADEAKQLASPKNFPQFQKEKQALISMIDEFETTDDIDDIDIDSEIDTESENISEREYVSESDYESETESDSDSDFEDIQKDEYQAPKEKQATTENIASENDKEKQALIHMINGFKTTDDIAGESDNESENVSEREYVSESDYESEYDSDPEEGQNEACLAQNEREVADEENPQINPEQMRGLCDLLGASLNHIDDVLQDTHRALSKQNLSVEENISQLPHILTPPKRTNAPEINSRHPHILKSKQ